MSCIRHHEVHKEAPTGTFVVCDQCGATLGKVHDLKCHPPYFAAVRRGDKPFEVRLNDRDYQAGDHLRLREWTPDEEYTGAETVKKVSYLMPGGRFGIAPDHVVMGIRSPES